jgi:hypothetical protein
MTPWASMAAYEQGENFAADVHRAMSCDQRRFTLRVAVTPAPVQLPTQWPHVSSFT